MYKVYDQNEKREFEVSPEWLDEIPRKKDIEYLLLFRLPATGENLVKIEMDVWIKAQELPVSRSKNPEVTSGSSARVAGSLHVIAEKFM